MGKAFLLFLKRAAKYVKRCIKAEDFSEDALILAKAAMIIRNGAFRHECFKFMVIFPPNVRRIQYPQASSLLSL